MLAGCLVDTLPTFVNFRKFSSMFLRTFLPSELERREARVENRRAPPQDPWIAAAAAGATMSKQEEKKSKGVVVVNLGANTFMMERDPNLLW